MNDILIGMGDLTEATQGDVRSVEERTRILARLQKSDSRRLGEKEWEIAILKEELEKHKLAIEALTRFLIEKQVVDEKELLDFVSEVDAEDGAIDGKLAIDTSRNRPRRLVFEKKPRRKMIIPGSEGETTAQPDQAT